MDGTVTQQNSNTVATGNVISQDPASGSSPAQGSPVISSAQDCFPGSASGRVSSDIPAVRWVWAATQPQLRPINDSWRVDETYIRVKGNWAYLYQATQ
jgi:hypothetical protein